MRRYPGLIVFLCGFFWPIVGFSANYELISQKNVANGEPVRIEFKANNFYSAYYIYLNVIKALALDNRLSRSEVEELVVKIIQGLKQGSMLQLKVPGYTGGELRVTLRTGTAKLVNKPILMLVTNYDVRRQKIVSEKNVLQAYASYFYLVRDKLVKFQYVSDKKNLLKKAKASANGLADFYLLDAEHKNDKKGKKLLVKAIKKETNEADRFIMHLTLSEYYLLERKLNKAKTELDKAEKLVDSIPDDKKKQYMQKIFEYANDIYRLVEKMKRV